VTRTICVSGAASGIAAALATRLRADGHRVIGVDRDRGEHITVVADLSDADGRAAAVAGVLAACEGRLDGLAALAGVGPQVGVEGQVRVNYFGAVALLDGLHDALAAGDAPAAVVASSVAASLAPCDDELLATLLAGDEQAALKRAVEVGDAGVGYATAKRALAVTARRRAPEWIAGGVRLNALAPGNTHTALTRAAVADPEFGPRMEAVPVPRGAWAQPEEIAAAAAFALSPDASFLVGSFLVIDGGTDALVRPDTI
jgi:NAD(P)-dependent dehydrogenase (short-subunit alcohol dehydrogenase family)